VIGFQEKSINKHKHDTEVANLNSQIFRKTSDLKSPTQTILKKSKNSDISGTNI
jgi:hypothetical protein